MAQLRAAAKASDPLPSAGVAAPFTGVSWKPRSQEPASRLVSRPYTIVDGRTQLPLFSPKTLVSTPTGRQLGKHEPGYQCTTMAMEVHARRDLTFHARARAQTFPGVFFPYRGQLFPQQQQGRMITYNHDEMPHLFDFSNMRDRCESSLY